MPGIGLPASKLTVDVPLPPPPPPSTNIPHTRTRACACTPPTPSSRYPHGPPLPSVPNHIARTHAVANYPALDSTLCGSLCAGAAAVKWKPLPQSRVDIGFWRWLCLGSCAHLFLNWLLLCLFWGVFFWGGRPALASTSTSTRVGTKTQSSTQLTSLARPGMWAPAGWTFTRRAEPSSSLCWTRYSVFLPSGGLGRRGVPDALGLDAVFYPCIP